MWEVNYKKVVSVSLFILFLLPLVVANPNFIFFESFENITFSSSPSNASFTAETGYSHNFGMSTQTEPFVTEGDYALMMFGQNNILNRGISVLPYYEVLMFDMFIPNSAPNTEFFIDSYNGTDWNQYFYTNETGVQLDVIVNTGGTAGFNFQTGSFFGQHIYIDNVRVFETEDDFDTYIAQFEPIEPLFSVYQLDTTVPISHVEFNETAGGDDWFISNVTATIVGYDNVSGIENFYFCIDQDNECVPQPTTTGLVIDEDYAYYNVTVDLQGFNYLRYYFQNGAGMQQILQIEEVKLDLTNPVSTSSVVSGTLGGATWYVSDIEVGINATDLESGVDIIYYCIDTNNTCEPTNIYSSPINITNEGVSYVRYYSTDIAGNIETIFQEEGLPNVDEYRIDKTNPTSSVNTTGTEGDNDWFISDVDVSITGIDNESGINDLYICLDNSDTCVPQQSEIFTLLGQEVQLDLRRNGNPVTTFFLEQGEPQTYTTGSYNLVINVTDDDVINITGTITYPSSCYSIASIDWSFENNAYTVNYVDFVSGGICGGALVNRNAATTYELESPIEVTQSLTDPNTFSIELNIEGINYLRYYFEDVAGNTQDLQSLEIKIDKTLPTTYGQITGGNSINNLYIPYARFTLFEQDAYSGVNETYYCVYLTNQNESTCVPDTLYTNHIFLSQPGPNYVRFYSVDNAGLIQPTQTTFAADMLSIFNEAQFTDDSTDVFPEIGDKISLNGSISTNLPMQYCELYIDTNGTPFNPTHTEDEVCTVQETFERFLAGTTVSTYVIDINNYTENENVSVQSDYKIYSDLEYVYILVDENNTRVARYEIDYQEMLDLSTEELTPEINNVNQIYDFYVDDERIFITVDIGGTYSIIVILKSDISNYNVYDYLTFNPNNKIYSDNEYLYVSGYGSFREVLNENMFSTSSGTFDVGIDYTMPATKNISSFRYTHAVLRGTEPSATAESYVLIDYNDSTNHISSVRLTTNSTVLNHNVNNPNPDKYISRVRVYHRITNSPVGTRVSQVSNLSMLSNINGLTKIDLSTMEIDAYTRNNLFKSGGLSVTELTGTNNELYVATDYNSQNKVWKLDKEDLTILEEGLDYGGEITSLKVYDNYLYVAGLNNGSVLKLNKDSLNLLEVSDVYGDINDMVIYQNNIYVAGDLGYIKQYHLDNLSQTGLETFTMEPILSLNYYLAYDILCEQELTGHISNITIDGVPGSGYVLPFEYTTNVQDTPQPQTVEWFVMCVDDLNTTFTSEPVTFDVQDAEPPEITEFNTNLNVDTNTTVISRNLYDLYYNISIFDFNLDFAQVTVECEESGFIHNVTDNTPINRTINITSSVDLSSYPLQQCQFNIYATDTGGNNLNYTEIFYIGTTLDISAIDLYDSSSINNYNYNLTKIEGLPGLQINDTVTTTTKTLENVSAGTYFIMFDHVDYLQENYTIVVNETSNSVIYETSESQITFIFTNVATLHELSNFNITIVDNDNIHSNRSFTAVNSTSLTVPILEGNYTVYWSKENYVDSNGTFVIGTLERKTFTSTTNFFAKLSLIDERTLGPFDMGNPLSVDVNLICAGFTVTYTLDDSYYNETLNETVYPSDFDIEIVCPVDKFKYVLTYADGITYFRDLLLPPEETFEMEVYLIDITVFPFVYSAFILDDLLNVYENPRIYIKKQLPQGVVTIISDYVDIENKVGAFMIENDEYIIEVHSDNKPVKFIGRYNANDGLDKIIQLYEVNLRQDGTGFTQNVRYYMNLINDSTYGRSVHFSYQDLENKTESVQFVVYANEIGGEIIHESPVFNSQSVVSSYLVPIGNETRTLISEIRLLHQEIGTQTATRMLNRDFTIRLPLSDHLSQEFMNWAIILLLSTVAIFANVRTHMASLTLSGLALMFAIFGWFQIAISVIALAILLSLIEFLTRRKR